MDYACLGRQLYCEFEVLGLLADVTFKRVDDAASAAPSSLYGERHEFEKVHHTWHLKALVDENPKKNIHGATGAEVTGEIHFVLYSLLATAGTRVGETYIPLEEDSVHYRGRDYPITRIERLLPSGENNQMGYRVMARRFA